ncbi:MAG: DUF2079 domain-containing protein, partial [candidate division WOR-3 bacterium]
MKMDVLVVQTIASALIGFFVWFSYKRGWGDGIAISDRRALVGILCASGLHFLVFSVLTSFRYLAMVPAAMDLGVYENTLWRVSHGEWVRLLESYTHTMPVLLFPALVYRLFPHPFTMLILQSGAIGLSAYLAFRLARIHLPPFPAFVIGLAFLLHPGTSWLNLFDFHPDSFWPPLFLGAAIGLERGKKWAFLILGILLVLIKEPLALSGAALGLYALWTNKARWQGFALIVLGILFFSLSVLWFIPALMDRTYPYYEAYRVFLPQHVPAKLVFLINILGPYAFVPLASPMELISALPHAIASLVSNNPTHFSIRYQYSASLVPALTYALVFVLKKARRPSSLALGVLISSCLFHIFVSPSPLSYEFWAKHRSGYHFSRYIPDQRDREVTAFLESAIPKDPDVSVCISDQGGVYSSVIGRRWRMSIFPHGVGECDMVVVDTSGEPLLWGAFYPIEDEGAFRAELKRVSELYEPIGSCRGVVVYKRAKGVSGAGKPTGFGSSGRWRTDWIAPLLYTATYIVASSTPSVFPGQSHGGLFSANLSAH